MRNKNWRAFALGLLTGVEQFVVVLDSLFTNDRKLDLICRRGYFTIVCLFLVYVPINARLLEKSESIQPEWVKKGEAKYNSKRSNDTYYFKVIENSGSSLESIKNQNLSALATYIGQENKISSSIKANISYDSSTGDEKDEYLISYTTNSSTDVFFAKLVDEYWELKKLDNGQQMYTYYALFAVSSKKEIPDYDQFFTTKSYGGTGFARSLIPGMGQIYKGQKGKGTGIIIGEAAGIASIIYCQSMRTSYHNKMIEQPKHAKEYHNKESNWQTARNICIGVTASLYVYNLIDAALASGAKRIVIKKNNNYSMSMRPTYIDGNTGLALSLKF